MNEDRGAAIERGTVCQVGEAGTKNAGKVKVRFDHLDNRTDEATPLESPWLWVLVQWPSGNRAANLPPLGAQVAAILDPDWETGFVLGGIYSQAEPFPTLPSPTSRFLDFPDGTKVFHDPEAHLTRVEGPGDLEADMEGDVDVQAGGSATVAAGADLLAQAGGEARLKGATVVIEGPTTFTAAVTFQAAVTAQSTIDATGEITGNGVALSAHVHGGVTPGGGTSGPPA